MTQEKKTMFPLVDAWRKSGKTRKEFSHEHTMKVAAFAYWISRKKKSEHAIN